MGTAGAELNVRATPDADMRPIVRPTTTAGAEPAEGAPPGANGQREGKERGVLSTATGEPAMARILPEIPQKAPTVEAQAAPTVEAQADAACEAS